MIIEHTQTDADIINFLIQETVYGEAEWTIQKYDGSEPLEAVREIITKVNNSDYRISRVLLNTASDVGLYHCYNIIEGGSPPARVVNTAEDIRLMDHLWDLAHLSVRVNNPEGVMLNTLLKQLLASTMEGLTVWQIAESTDKMGISAATDLDDITVALNAVTTPSDLENNSTTYWIIMRSQDATMDGILYHGPNVPINSWGLDEVSDLRRLAAAVRNQYDEQVRVEKERLENEKKGNSFFSKLGSLLSIMSDVNRRK